MFGLSESFECKSPRDSCSWLTGFEVTCGAELIPCKAQALGLLNVLNDEDPL